MKLRSLAIPAALAFGSLAAAPPSGAADLTVFAAQATPTETWRPGFGATLSAGILGIAAVEIEMARASTEIEGGDMTNLSVSALLAPAIGPLVPFAGFGTGLYFQNLGSANTFDVANSFAAGLKVNIGRVFVLRGEFRRFTLSGPVRIETEDRYSVGAGIQF